MELDSSQFVSEISGLMKKKLLIEVSSPEQDLLDSGLLDSLTLVQLLLELESRYGVSIPLEELELDDFRTLASIARLVQRRRSVASAPDSPVDGEEERRHDAPALITPVMRGSAGQL